MEPRWMNIKEASKYAGCTRPTMMEFIKQGLKVSKIGNRTYRVKRDDIDTFFEDHYYEGAKTIAKNIIAEMS